MGETVSTKSTYHFDTFTDINQQKELKRLENQAMLVSDIEQSAIKEIGLPKQGIFLDLGCGPGFVSGEIARNHRNLSILGMDISKELLSVASEIVQPQHSNLTFQEGNSYATQLNKESVDIVYSRLLYQHLEEPLKAMAEAKRILKPGGKLCVLDVDDQFQCFYPDLKTFPQLQNLAQKYQKINGGNRHIGRALPHLMSKSGYKNIKYICKSVSTLDIGFDAFFDIVVSFKTQISGLEGSDLLEQLKKEIQALDTEPF